MNLEPKENPVSVLAKFVILRYRNRILVTSVTVTRDDVAELLDFAQTTRDTSGDVERVRLIFGELEDADVWLSPAVADELAARAFAAEDRLFAGRAG
jgi:hypothetical protein